MAVRILNGNELIVQGALEAGFDLYTGYPGSPLADYFTILEGQKERLNSRGIQVAIANSEANAAAMASGAKQAGRDCLLAMKSMGLNVAADALSVGNFARPGEDGRGDTPAVVVVVGDDPWSISTSAPMDSRYLFKHLHIPFLEPATPRELKDWIGVAARISAQSSIYQGVLLSTFMAEGGGRVEVAPWAAPRPGRVSLDTSQFDLQKLVMVPPNSLVADEVMNRQRFPRLLQILGREKLDTHTGPESAPIGFLSSGATFETLRQVLADTGLLERVGLYKVACPWPLSETQLLPWLAHKKSVVVVEEKRGFLEAELSHLVSRHKLDLAIAGKNFATGEGFAAHGGLSYEMIEQKVRELAQGWGYPLGDKAASGATLGEKLPPRTPTFCPGCPHRETLSLLVDLRKTLATKGLDLISHGDVGCYSLSFLPPFKEMHNLSAMGQGGALGAGVDLFSENPSVVLMGDSTFYHSGVTDISNSVQLDHDITYILLDNDNTAMTGHQATPASGVNVQGKSRPRQDMLATVKALGVARALEVNPSDRYFYKNVLQELVPQKGVKVIVSNKECALTFHGRKKAKERQELAQGPLGRKEFYQINTDVCEDCRECVELTGCPGLSQTFGAYGPKVTIDPQICVADSYCTKLKACPSFELVEVLDYRPVAPRLQERPAELPEPIVSKDFDAIAGGRDWRALVTGVGGSGVTTISRVLAEAAREMGGRDDLDFKFVDQKGLAQRNGNVTAHLSIVHQDKSCSAVTPVGSADLLLSTDLLDGAGHIRFLSPQGRCLVDESFQVPLSIMLDRGLEKEPLREAKLRRALAKALPGRADCLPFKSLAAKRLGKGVYASAMVLGAAFQRGLLPFSRDNMLAAFERALPKAELSPNLGAFELGRELIVHGVPGSPEERLDQVDLLRADIGRSFLPWIAGRSILAAFDRNLATLVRHFPDTPREHLARYLRDIYIYDRGAKVEDFLIDAGSVANLYKSAPEERDIALRTLARTYWIKDEVFVAHLLISDLQKRKDQDNWAKLGRTYKVTHINRPHFDLWGLAIEFDLNSRNWMLHIMRHLRLLRVLLPGWHRRERQIARRIRQEILQKVPDRRRLAALENIKGYREVRYRAAKAVFDEPTMG